MDIFQKIENVSKAIKALSDDIEELKLMASQVSPLRSPPRSPSPEADAGLKVIVGYLALSPGMEEDDLLNTLMTCAMNVVGAEGAAVTIYDDEKKVLTFRAAVGIAADRIIGCRVPLGSSQHGIAFRMQQVISSTPMYKVIDDITGEKYRNVLAAPLLINNEAIGTLGAVNKKTGDHFTPQDMEAYQSFADLAAHIIRQRLRENSLREVIDGGAPDVPRDLPGLNIMKEDRELLEITRNLAVIGQRSPELFSVCKELVGAMAGMAV